MKIQNRYRLVTDAASAWPKTAKTPATILPEVPADSYKGISKKSREHPECKEDEAEKPECTQGRRGFRTLTNEAIGVLNNFFEVSIKQVRLGTQQHPNLSQSAGIGYPVR